MVPPPKPPHGDIAAKLNVALVKFLLSNYIDGVVHHPPEAIWLRREEGSTYLEPGMMYLSKTLNKRMGQKRTSADIVFEYLSRSTSVYDRTTKADTYLALGVRELWLVDPATTTIEVRHPNHKQDVPAWETTIYRTRQKAKSRVLEGWEVSVPELFDG